MTQTSITVRRRAAVLLLGCAAAFFLLGLRLVFLQLIQGDSLQQGALRQRYRVIDVDPRRGTIFDRNGRKLAVSVHSDGLICIPREVRKGDARKTASLLASILEDDAYRLEKLFAKRASFLWVKRRLTPEQVRKVRDHLSEMPGVQLTVRAQRSYPKGALAAQLIGITGIDNQGLEGIEKRYDEYLRGTPGRDMAEFDTTGAHIPGGEKRYLPPTPGLNVVLTIDDRLQYIAERELERAMIETQSARGLIVAMDPKTGEILACAIKPGFDPNSFAGFPVENRRNFLLTDQYEPGSTFKIITSCAALEEGEVTLESTFFDPGFIRVEDRNLHCWKAGGHGSETFVEAVENSCNPVFASLALKLGQERMYRYMRAFGLGKPAGIDFPGEASGSLMNRKSVGPVELANMGFGQGVSVTALQLIGAMGAIANGGTLMRPYFVRELQRPDGTVFRRYEPKAVRQVISAKTAATMAQLLESVVVNGSGNRAGVEGYRVAGKTGTAQKAKGGRYTEDRIASFIGFAPVDDPRIVMLVLLDEPKSVIRYGGVLAAPIFGAVMGEGLRYLGVLPRVEKKPDDSMSTEVTVPNIQGLPLGEAQGVLASKGLAWRLVKSGAYVMDQFPRAGSQVKRGTQVLIYFETEERLNDKAAGYVVVPDLRGLTWQEAEDRLRLIGLVLAPAGSGLAVKQHPDPGSKLPPGARVSVEFRPPKSP